MSETSQACFLLLLMCNFVTMHFLFYHKDCMFTFINKFSYHIKIITSLFKGYIVIISTNNFREKNKNSSDRRLTFSRLRQLQSHMSLKRLLYS